MAFWSDEELETLSELFIIGDLDIGIEGLSREARRCIEHGLSIRQFVLSGDGSRLVIWFKRSIDQQAAIDYLRMAERPESIEEVLAYFRGAVVKDGS